MARTVIDKINSHTKHSEKCYNEQINWTFFWTLDQNQEGTYEDGLGESVNDMPPSELFARIKARDSIGNPKPTIPTPINKEANFCGKTLGSRIGGSDNKGRHGRKYGGNRPKQGFPPYCQNKRPSKEYIARR
jgi:hypothetical protein